MHAAMRTHPRLSREIPAACRREFGLEDEDAAEGGSPTESQTRTE
jgi:hypothetical protein